jgi:hypothetical protein
MACVPVINMDYELFSMCPCDHAGVPVCHTTMGCIEALLKRNRSMGYESLHDRSVAKDEMKFRVTKRKKWKRCSTHQISVFFFLHLQCLLFVLSYEREEGRVRGMRMQSTIYLVHRKGYEWENESQWRCENGFQETIVHTYLVAVLRGESPLNQLSSFFCLCDEICFTRGYSLME